jgi:glycosyltransferase involved in cell wall biosynthesis
VRTVRCDSYDDLNLQDDDVVLATFWTTVAPLLARVTKPTTVVHFVQSYETWAADPAEVEAAYRLPVQKIAVSPAVRDQLLTLKVPTDMVVVVPNGVNLDTFTPGDPPSNRAARVAFQASDVPLKGLEVAVEVIERVSQMLPAVEWVAFGPGRRPGALPANVTYFRSVPQHELSSRVYSRAAVYLCTSYREGWGLPVLEAMACRAAVVSTRNGGVEAFAEHEKSALLCPVADAGSLATAVTTLLSDSLRRTALAEKGRAVAAGYDIAASAQAFATALEKARK